MPNIALIDAPARRRPARAGTCRARSRTRAGRRRRRRPAARGRRSRPRSSGASALITAPTREQHEHRGQHPALAVEVAELADDRRRDRGADQEAGQDPRDGRRRRVELLRQRRQRGHDERLRERERDARARSASAGRASDAAAGSPPLAAYERQPPAMRRAISVKVASTSSSIVRRKTASSACAGERADVLDRLGQLAPALGHARLGERLPHVVHEQLDELARDGARVALDALDHVERVVEARRRARRPPRRRRAAPGSAPRSGRRRAGPARRASRPWRSACAGRRPRQRKRSRELGGGHDLGRLGRLAGGALEREQPLAGVARAGA